MTGFLIFSEQAVPQTVQYCCSSISAVDNGVPEGNPALFLESNRLIQSGAIAKAFFVIGSQANRLSFL